MLLMDETIIEQCGKHSGRHISAIVVFGSTVSGLCDTHSDLDVLCILEEGRPQAYNMSVRTLDIEFRSIDLIRDSLKEENWRNNIPLMAIRTGRTIFDPAGLMRELTERMERLWLDGTGSITMEDCKNLTAGISKLETSARKSVERLRVGDRGLITFQMSSLYLSALTLYYRSHAVWAYPPWVTSALPDYIYRQTAEHNSVSIGGLDPIKICEGLLSYCEMAKDHLTLRRASDGRSFCKELKFTML